MQYGRAGLHTSPHIAFWNGAGDTQFKKLNKKIVMFGPGDGPLEINLGSTRTINEK